MKPDGFQTIEWTGDAVVLLDQRRLPVAEDYLRCADWPAVATAIKTMVVRGAPAIGITAADQVNNEGVISAVYCATPEEVITFFER